MLKLNDLKIPATLRFGLALRYPLESEYSALRRFAKANSHMKCGRLRVSLRSAFGVSDPLHKLDYGYCIQQLELAYCRAYGIPYQTPRPFKGNRPTKQCYRCATSGFHSDTYNYVWFKECPIHHVELTEHCPHCHERWPTKAQLIVGRRCHVCGSKELYQDTAQTGVSETLIRERIAPIVRMIDQANKTKVYSFIAIGTQYRVYPSVTVNNLSFAPLWASYEPASKALFRRVNAPICPVEKFDVRSRVSEKCPLSSFLHIQIECERRALEKMKRFISEPKVGAEYLDWKKIYFTTTPSKQLKLAALSIWFAIMGASDRLMDSAYFYHHLDILSVFNRYYVPKKPHFTDWQFEHCLDTTANSVLTHRYENKVHTNAKLKRIFYEYQVQRLYHGLVNILNALRPYYSGEEELFVAMHKLDKLRCIDLINTPPYLCIKNSQGYELITLSN